MSPSYVHSYVHTNLIKGLAGFNQYSVFTELTLEIDGKDYTPDVSVYNKRTVNLYKDVIKMTEMPLLAVEILSPNQGTQEILDKFEIYFPAGIQSYWLIIPPARTVSVFSAVGQGRSFTEQEVVDDVLKIQLSVAEIFG